MNDVVGGLILKRANSPPRITARRGIRHLKIVPGLDNSAFEERKTAGSNLFTLSKADAYDAGSTRAATEPRLFGILQSGP